MPVGLIFMEWDDRIGAKILTSAPEEIKLNDKTMLQIISTHEYSGETGMISFFVGSLNIASYYTGPDTKKYLILLLNLEEDPDAYEGGLSDVSRIVLQNLEDGSYLGMVSSLYKRLSAYPTLNFEQSLAFLYQDELNRLIINRLRDEGVFTKSELSVWLKDLYRKRVMDIDGFIMGLNRREILKEATIKGISSELIFLTNDIMMMRKPPLDLLRKPLEKGLPERFVEEYREEVRKYFLTYRPSEDDNLKMLGLLTDPEVYEVLKLLRITTPTKDALVKLKEKGVEDLDGALKKLWDSQMFLVFQDTNGLEFYALKTDFHVSLMFPKYIVNTIIHQFEVKSKVNKVLIEYLSVLEDSYYALKAPKKSAAEEM
jgi:hypothetical protein